MLNGCYGHGNCLIFKHLPTLKKYSNFYHFEYSHKRFLVLKRSASVLVLKIIDSQTELGLKGP